MINDVLTGKTAPEGGTSTGSDDPYRAPGEVSTTECTTCHTSLPAAQAIFGRCPSCSRKANDAINAVLGNAQQSAMAYAAMAEDERRRARTATIVKWVVTAILIIGIAAFRFGMRSSMRDDMRQMNGEPTWEIQGIEPESR